MIYAIEIEGIIEIHTRLPKIWNGANGYRGSATPDQIYTDGFREFVEPTLLQYEKTGDMYLDVSSDTYTRHAIPFTQEEIEVYDNNQALAAEDIEDSDEAGQFHDNRVQKGQRILTQVAKYIYRKRFNTPMTKLQSVKLTELFFDSIAPLSIGYFEASKKRVNAITQVDIDATFGAEDLKTKIKDKINKYLAGE
jgi:hypothetical protein